MLQPILILASQSPMRRKLLEKIHVVPDKIIPADIDETPREGENAISLSKRLAKAKNQKIAASQQHAIIITADTVPMCEGHTLDKAVTQAGIIRYLDILSGKKHEIYTSICISKKENDTIDFQEKTVKATITFKDISAEEKKYYASLEEGIGKAAGYNIDGYAESFISSMEGSFSNVCGLPLYETVAILRDFAYLA